MTDEKAQTRALWSAISKGEHNLVRKLLAAGVAPDSPLPLMSKATDTPRISPLHVVAAQGDIEGARILLEGGADVEGNFASYTPLLAAVLIRQSEMVEFLAARGARTNFLIACARGDVSVVDDDLEGDPALAQACDELGRSPLHIAAYAFEPDVVLRLLEAGAVVDATDALGVTPLLSATDARHDDPSRQLAVLRTLVAAGADVDARNHDQVTALHRAVRARSTAAVSFLLEHGVDVNARDKGRGSTPLRRAVNNTGAGGTAGRTDAALEIAGMLLQHGANPNDKDKAGRSILAAARGKAMKALLVEHGAR